MPAPLTLLHRNELTIELDRAVDDELPCVLARTATSVVRPLGPADIEAFGAGPQLLVSQLALAVAESELRLPSTD